jgi:soluble lytic murein transglycosylase
MPELVKQVRGWMLLAALLLGALLRGAGLRAQRVVEAGRLVQRGECPAVAGVSDPGERALVLAWRVRCLLEHHAWSEAADSARALSADPVLPELANALPWVPEVVARGLMHAGALDEAESLLRGALASEMRLSQEAQARLTHRLALVAELRGGGDVAAHAAVVQQWPASVWALRSAVVAPMVLPSAQSRLSAGQRALDGRNYPLAEALLTAAACPDERRCSAREAARSAVPARVEAAWRLGFLLYRYRREHVDRALVWLGAVMEAGALFAGEARATYARAVQRMDRPAEARRAWQRVLDGGEVEAGLRDEALLQVGLLWLVEGEWASAAAALQRAEQATADTTVAMNALRWRAWAAYRSGDCGSAMALWSTMGGSDRRRDEARYWTAVCVSATDLAQAQQQWRALASEGAGWYAVLSLWRLGIPLSELGVPVAAAASEATDDVGGRLAALGLSEEAGWLWSRASVAAGGSGSAGSVTERWRRARSAHAALSGRWPAASADMAGWRALHPRAYEADVLAAATAHGVRPELVWAIMQKESLYSPAAISVSDAMGLMQVVPQTATSIAVARGIYYEDGMLFRPAVATDYGAWYLAALLHKYEGQYPLAIAAYNAGPVAMDDWIGRFGGLPIDEFVEHIVFDQARNYVKSVFPLMVAYLVASGDAAVVSQPLLGGLLPERAITTPLAGVEF